MIEPKDCMTYEGEYKRGRKEQIIEEISFWEKELQEQEQHQFKGKAQSEWRKATIEVIEERLSNLKQQISEGKK